MRGYLRFCNYFFDWESLLIQIVAKTAIIVTRIAYVSIAMTELCSPKICWKIFWIAEFHARAAMSPNAPVNNIASFSITSFFIGLFGRLCLNIFLRCDLGRMGLLGRMASRFGIRYSGCRGVG